MEQIRLDLIPNGVMPNVHASQFDNGRTIRFNLYEGESPFSLLATDYVKVACNNSISVSTANIGNSHDWTIPDSVVADSGVFIGELTIERDSVVVGSKNFVLNVEEDAYNGKNLEERTASGTIANFETNLQDNLTACKCSINPVQDLHGYSKPWSGGAGKNKVDFPSYASASSQNLTIQTTGNGGFKVTGTPSTSWAILTSNIDVNIPSGQAITFGITGGTLSHNVYLNLTYADSTTDTLLIHSGNTSITMTLAKNLIKVRLDFSGMSTSTNYNDTFYPMLEYGSTQSAFEPYSNICPISGFSALNVTLADGDMQTVDTKTVNFGQTVYGGVLDVTNGKLKIETGFRTCDGSENWQVSGSGTSQIFYLFLSDMESGLNLNGISNYIPTGNDTGTFCIRFGYNSSYAFIYQAVNALGVSDLASFKTYLSNNPLELCYPLATPTEITLTPKQIEAIVGINNVYHDCNGQTEVKYLVEV